MMHAPLVRTRPVGRLVRLAAIGTLLLWGATAAAQPRRPAASGSALPSSAPTAAPGRPTASPDDAESATARSPEQRKARLDRHKKWAKDWRGRRELNKKARGKRLRYRLHRALEGKPIPEPVRAELELHARRMARLYRLKELAVGKEDEAAIDRVEALVRRENARHERWIGDQTGSGERGRAPAPRPTAEPEEAQP